MVGVDAQRNLQGAAEEFYGQYATDVFTNEAVSIIRKNDALHPMFLQVSHAAPHAVKGNLLQVRNLSENDRQFGFIKNKQRRLLAGKLAGRLTLYFVTTPILNRRPTDLSTTFCFFFVPVRRHAFHWRLDYNISLQTDSSKARVP